MLPPPPAPQLLMYGPKKLAEVLAVCLDQTQPLMLPPPPAPAQAAALACIHPPAPAPRERGREAGSLGRQAGRQGGRHTKARATRATRTTRTERVQVQAAARSPAEPGFWARVAGASASESVGRRRAGAGRPGAGVGPERRRPSPAGFRHRLRFAFVCPASPPTPARPGRLGAGPRGPRLASGRARRSGPAAAGAGSIPSRAAPLSTAADSDGSWAVAACRRAVAVWTVAI